MSDKENLHKDHRSRLKRRYAREGLGNFEDHNILELLLFYSIPRRDTNPIAHLLLNRFGSLHGVFEASEEELCKVEGVGPTTASFIKLCPEVWTAVFRSKFESEPFITGSRIGQYFVNLFRFSDVDAACILFLDAKMNFVSLEMIQNSLLDAPRDIVERTLSLSKDRKALYAILAHNHPDGNVEPTALDIKATDDIGKELYSIGIHLLAHYIVSGFDFNNYMDKKNEERE